ncbi:MAG: archaetidylserine decarboxylase [Firmicutes bacterium]|nr:archaetidylserine decarboxylase [Bacillota bacterium]
MKPLPLYRGFPRRSWTRIVGWYARSTLSRPAIGYFVERYGIDVSELEKPLDEYATLAEFFTRRLAPGARPVANDPSLLVSPCDGVLAQHGALADGTLIQAKGRVYTVERLLSGDSHLAQEFCGGWYWTIYLSPRDYHRVHAPISGDIIGYAHVPGTLYPVNDHGVQAVPDLFVQNERVVTYLATPMGRVAVVMVGAFVVGGITLAFAPELHTNRRPLAVKQVWLNPSKAVTRGEELGAFTFGSTVIVLAEAQRVTPDPGMVGMRLRMGMALGRTPRGGG